MILTCAVAFAVYWTRPNDIGSRSGGKKITTAKTMSKLENGASSGMTVSAAAAAASRFVVNVNPNDDDASRR